VAPVAFPGAVGVVWIVGVVEALEAPQKVLRIVLVAQSLLSYKQLWGSYDPSTPGRRP